MNIIRDFIRRSLLSPELLSEKRRNDQEYNIHALIETVLSSPSPPKILKDDDDLKKEIREILNESVQTPTIKGIECKDGECTLLLQKDDSTIVSVSLVQFGLKLAQAFEEKLTSTALCFIADASSGLGTKILGEVASTCGAGLVS